MTEEPIKVVLFAADCGGYDIERSMEELAALAQANGMEAVAEVVQKRETPEAATFLGEGRLAEGRMLCINLGAECAVFDAELSGSQIRNLEELLEVQVIDRTMLILEIFASRAVTNEGKLQTELATLDPTARRLSLPSGLACVAVDTVGFVSRLPHNLVQAFKSTLEEAAFADVILKVCDASDPEAAAQLAVTDDVLGELGCGDIPQIVVYNKCDRVENAALFDTSAVRTSTVTGEGLDALLARLDAALAGRVRRIAVLLPYDKLGEATPMRENGTVLTEEYRPEGVYLEGIVKTMDLHRFTPYLV